MPFVGLQLLVEVKLVMNYSINIIKYARYKNICEIGKERIRRAGKKIIADNQDKDLSSLDTGFKVFKLDSSNIKEWDFDTQKLKDIIDYKEYTKKLKESGEFNIDNMSDDEIATKILEYYLQSHIENIKPDRKHEDLLYEILLKYGLDLTLPIEEKIIESKKVFVIGFGALVVCLDDNITTDIVEKIADLKEEYEAEVMRVVFKDSSFKDAVVKTNAIAILNQHGIDEIVSV